ncbi:MAG: tyrosine-type recombinase/integrase [Terriglobia bacterium]
MRKNQKSSGKGCHRPKARLGLPDLDQAKAAVLGCLRSREAERGYRHSINEFITWHCSEPRLSFNKTVVTRYRIHLESRQLAPGTINVRLAAVRLLAYAEEARRLWQSPGSQTLKGKRDRALLAVLLGCGPRRRELAELTLDLLQRREDHWAIVDLVGKGGHIRTVPVPDWVKETLDDWLLAAGIVTGRVFRCVCRAGKTWGNGMTERVVWHVVKEYAGKLNLTRLAPHDLRRSCARLCHAERWSKFNSCWAMSQYKPQRPTLDASSVFTAQ